MEININNYEEFVIDFMDGKLNEMDAANLLTFLSQNPTLKEEFDLLNSSDHSITIENISFDSSSLLKPLNVNVNNYSDKLIALIENDLPENEKAILLSEINQYPELKKEHELFLKTKLIPETNIVFNGKESLTKKPFRIIPLFTKISAIAALFIAVIIVFYFVNNNNSDNQVANNEAIVKAKQDSISNILKSRNNVPKILQQENEKQMIAFGGVNAAVVKKNSNIKKSNIAPANQNNKNSKTPLKENPLNNNNGQSVAPPQLPKKVISDNGLSNNQVAQAEIPKVEEKEAVKENIVLPTLPNNNPVAVQNNDPIKNENDLKSLPTYVKQQLQITGQSAVIAVNKPADLNEKITLAESLGLNVLSIYNKVSNRDVKVQKTYNNEGEVEKVRLVATGW